MSTEKTPVDKTITDYANLAFNPYAISTDDLTTDYDVLKGDNAMENGGFDGEAVIENNPHYEDTLEVAKKAGLTGVGRRKKENIIYEETVLSKKDKRPLPKPRPTNVPPQQAEDWSGISKDKHTQWRLPFGILCLLLLLCLVGSALGVLAYFDEKKCSCEIASFQEFKADKSISDVENDVKQQISDVESNYTRKIAELLKKIDSLQTKLDSVESQQKTQFNDTQRNVNDLNQQLSSSIESINTTFTVELKSVNYNVTSLSRDVDEIRNISKVPGPRGYNGSQGLQGVQGIANLTACVVKEKIDEKNLEVSHQLTKATVTISETQDYKIMAAVCSTKERFGVGQAALKFTNSDEYPKYTCTCGGASQLAAFKPASNTIRCVIIYWECPRLS